MRSPSRSSARRAGASGSTPAARPPGSTSSRARTAPRSRSATPSCCRGAIATWLEAGALFLVAGRRGARFGSAQQAGLAEARRELRRLARLEANLEKDVAELPEAETLRRQGEALLAAPQRVAPGAALAEL